MKNIFLTGYMGCGKSSVGRVLADRLGMPFVDLDQEIERQAGLSIKEIFARDGEPAFRALESRVLERVACARGAVVSTGGGSVIASANRAVMRENGVIVNLTASIETIVCRLSGDCERPLLQGDPSFDRVSAMLEVREEYYADADLRIDTTTRSVPAVAEEIVQFVRGGAAV